MKLYVKDIPKEFGLGGYSFPLTDGVDGLYTFQYQQTSCRLTHTADKFLPNKNSEKNSRTLKFPIEIENKLNFLKNGI